MANDISSLNPFANRTHPLAYSLTGSCHTHGGCWRTRTKALTLTYIQENSFPERRDTSTPENSCPILKSDIVSIT